MPEGQWLEAFKARFPTSDRKGPIGVPDDSWVRPLGFSGFPCVGSRGFSDFFWTGHELDEGWRWLVCVGE